MNITEINWIIKVPLHIKNRSFLEDRKLVMERLLDWNEWLKYKGYKHGIYNIDCWVVKGEDVGEPFPKVAICKAITYGDLPWLKKEERAPFKVSKLLDEFKVTKEELEETIEKIKIFKAR